MSTPESAARFSWPEMQRYWALHADVRANSDLTLDPEALDNVCTPGAPRWLNEYYARWQQVVYRGLLSSIPEPGRTSRALDVGCGAGRWCRVLTERGYDVTGIDLQPRLIEALRVRHPQMRFECVPAQEFSSPIGFDVISAVTVIAHNPFSEQSRVVTRLRSMLLAGGHAIVLENVRDQGRHVFSRSESEWIELFGDSGLELLRCRRYDFSPSLRFVSRGLAAARSMSGHTGTAADRDPSSHMVSSDAGTSRRLRQAVAVARRMAASVDSRIEPELIRRNARMSSVHCGFLFRAR